jgi:quercetin dioxygenase-like cupin family protein
VKPSIFVSALAATALCASAITAEVLQGAAQTHRVPQFENDAVKVWKTTVLPNQPLAMHHHDHPRVIVALTGGTMNIVDPAGNIDAHKWETGKAYWLPAMAPGTVHSDVNAGDKPMEVMVVELEKEK